MTVSFWRIAAETKSYPADDMTGTGARIAGGRWNDVGTAMIYAAGSRALACLETFVHLNSGGLPFNRYLVEITVPDDLHDAALAVRPANHPVGWDAEPAGRTSIAFGTEWANGQSSAILLMPSVIVPEEDNVLVNPMHPDAHRITARKVRKWLYDPRMARKT